MSTNRLIVRSFLYFGSIYIGATLLNQLNEIYIHYPSNDPRYNNKIIYYFNGILFIGAVYSIFKFENLLLNNNECHLCNRHNT